MTQPDEPKVYAIRPGQPFVDVLARGIIERAGGLTEKLADVRVLLPTRRACRSLREAFLRLSDGAPTLLPRMTPLGDVDEEELVIHGVSPGFTEADGAGAIPPAISGLRRQLTLARLIMAKEETTADQAASLAHELARLLDQLHTERVPFERLNDLVPDEFAEHWQLTLTFLRILTRQWPLVLAESGEIDPAEHRNRLLDAQRRRWLDAPPNSPVIAAGSTGSIPATADLLHVVSRLPNGAVVLPGLDQISSDEAWRRLEAHHPQFGMARLLEHLGTERSRVQPWLKDETGRATQREMLAIHGLAPAGSRLPDGNGSGVDDSGLPTLVECPAPREEAGVIALAVRQALEQPTRTVAVVTPDRQLARRVAGELARWGVEVDDSAGTPLALSPQGSFLRLAARAVEAEFAPVALLALLKHPLCSASMDRARCRSLVRQLETTCLRGPRPAPGIDGLTDAAAGDPALAPLMESLDRAAASFVDVFSQRSAGTRELLAANVRMIEALAETDAGDGASGLWSGDAGEELAAFSAELLDIADTLGDIPPRQYPALLDGLLGARAVRPRYGLHPRVSIWGLMEARLQHADLMILSGLNEGVWPPDAQASPWMSRQMMSDLGLPLPERRIGLTAHDFVQGFNANEVLLTRAERTEGAPTVASRWLLRLDNRMKALGREGGLPRSRRLLDLFRLLDKPEHIRPILPPSPAPPVEARPKGLSVTRVETWIRDPYSIYAERILGLRPLDALDADPGAADRGNLIHEALEKFIDSMPAGPLPEDAEDQLIAIGRQVFDSVLVRPGVRAFWWPRFLRLAEWFVSFESARRETGAKTLINEAHGKAQIPAGGITFRLSAKADRIDQLADGTLSILDYKTGQPPSARQVAAHLTPQLTLETVLVDLGAFGNLPKAPVAELAYVKLSGGREPGKFVGLKLDVKEVSREALEGLQRLIADYQNPKTPYRSRPRPQFQNRFGDYDHLARVREWASAEGDDG